jgi:hypothetical protein
MTGRWWKKLRGLNVLSVVGGLAGGLLGGVWFAVRVLLSGGAITPASLLTAAAIYAGFGALATAGVGVLLATAGTGKKLSELSVPNAGLFGAVLAAAVSVLFLALFGAVPAAALAGTALRVGALGGVLGAGVVAVAKRAESNELASSKHPLLTDGE